MSRAPATHSMRPDTSACEHLAAYLSPEVKHEPVSSHSSSRERYASVVHPAKRRKTSPSCHTCLKPAARPWACLSCDYQGCMLESDCMRDHWQTSCSFAIEPKSGGIWCQQCDDLVYSDTLEVTHRETLLAAEERSDHTLEQTSAGAKRRAPYRPWSGHVDAPPAPCRGLRPLLNLSQTCFLSAILQAFIHNPLLKSYFLSEKHNRHICPNSLSLPASGKGCMCCEMDRAFEEFHTDTNPYAPITMLYSMWHASPELEGYGQQDAHSFFLAALEQIHVNAKGQLSSCNCIAHQTFAGSLRSSVTCSTCQSTSSTVDPVLSIQLDIPPDPDLTLSALLRRFCARERIAYDCSTCGPSQASRDLVLKTLPPVLTFQLKRFAHDASASIKIDNPVTFPTRFNMRPYAKPAALPEHLYQYDLFAVVTHEGKLDNGHYWTDVLSEGEWWHCDDDRVTPVPLRDVLSQHAYMLFYVKHSLAYASIKKDTGVGGKGIASKGMGLGKSSHPIKGMYEL